MAPNDAFSAKQSETLPPFFPAFYTADMLLPGMEFGQNSTCLPTAFSITAALAAFKISAFFTAIALGSLTGLLNRE